MCISSFCNNISLINVTLSTFDVTLSNQNICNAHIQDIYQLIYFRTSMGEDVTEWIFEYVSAEEEEDTDTEAEEADSSGESEKDWHILREEAEDRY